MIQALGAALSLGVKVMDQVAKRSKKPSYKEWKERKDEMHDALESGNADNISELFAWMSDISKGGDTGRKSD